MANDIAVLPKRVKKPEWLRVKLPVGKKYTELRGLVDKYKLNTICTSGSCPNMGECWGEGTATFMILGNICTRSCGFCGVKTGRPETVPGNASVGKPAVNGGVSVYTDDDGTLAAIVDFHLVTKWKTAGDRIS